ncbi:hypothetical protein QFW77_08610 [Luteimonas sp. RD2P54]|uniref:Uncharacterized protein n=1 Tax=Luteimonas endophytica TaxID=3042023 RepID=A0ABT6J8A2_9GAMM|nr:hypothetical protein [Luteimonas endophytica]MDH5823049.1 hypothetical protein [Luteimonas endophytica]
MARLLLSIVLLSIVTACSPARAGHPVRLDIVDREHGGRLEQHRHRGETWIAGSPGHRYAVRLTNNSDERVLVVLSVDGINAVTGETADPAQSGYVLAPRQSTEIAGWRKSLDDVAQFVFTALPDSYAARTGRPDDVGVIGVAVFRERWTHRPEPMPSIAERAERRAAPAATAEMEQAMGDHAAHGRDAARQRIGTGHGAREWAPVGHTTFVRASRHPVQLLQLRYDTPQRLAALGIPAWRHAGYQAPRPRAFPGGFVPDP